MEKRGQMQISFGMIFSIIVIIATIAVAFYAIRFFLNSKNCAEEGYFLRDFDARVDQAWKGDMTNDIFTHPLPGGVKSVCFGNLSQPVSPDSQTKYNQIKSEMRQFGNVYLYPLSSVCNKKLSVHVTKNMKTDKFFCVDSRGGISVKITKGSFDNIPKVCKVGEC